MKTLASIIVLGLLAGCATTKPARTPEELRQIQTRLYTTSDTRLVMKAILSAFQDEGYIIKQTNNELGIIQATKQTDLGGYSGPAISVGAGSWGSGIGFGGGIGTSGSGKRSLIEECTANVSLVGTQTQVRINFQQTTANESGGVTSVEGLIDEKKYETFFSKVRKNLPAS